VARPKKGTCGVYGRHAHPDGIRHLPSERYQARFLGPEGKSYSKTFQTTKDAQAWLNRQHADISAGEWSKRDTLTVVTFSDYAERWLAKRKVKGRPLAARTLSNYHDVLDRFILGTFAHRPIHTITRDEVKSGTTTAPPSTLRRTELVPTRCSNPSSTQRPMTAITR